jgi:hypothetical protein
MNQQLKQFAVPALRWAVGMIVLLESVHFTFAPASLPHFARTGLPQWIRPALGGSEIVATLLFLLPAAGMVGGYLLLLIFSIAIAIHFSLGEFDVGSLIVYGMAVLVCMTHGKEAVAEQSHER